MKLVWRDFCSALFVVSALSSASAQSLNNTDSAISIRERVRITYDGTMQAVVTVKDESRNTRIKLGSFGIKLGGTRGVPVDAAYHVEVTYDGNEVTGVEQQNSSTRGASGSATFRGTRQGDECQIWGTEGQHYRARCTRDVFEYQYDYDNPQGQRVKSKYAAHRTASISLAELERQHAIAEQAKRQAADQEMIRQKAVYGQGALKKQRASMAAKSNDVHRNGEVSPQATGDNRLYTPENDKLYLGESVVLSTGPLFKKYGPLVENYIRQYVRDALNSPYTPSKYSEGSMVLVLGRSTRRDYSIVDVSAKYFTDTTFHNSSGRYWTEHNEKETGHLFFSGLNLLCEQERHYWQLCPENYFEIQRVNSPAYIAAMENIEKDARRRELSEWCIQWANMNRSPVKDCPKYTR